MGMHWACIMAFIHACNEQKIPHTHACMHAHTNTHSILFPDLSSLQAGADRAVCDINGGPHKHQLIRLMEENGDVGEGWGRWEAGR